VADRAQRVEAQVRVVEDPAVAVLEDAEEQAEANGDVGDVGNGDEELSARCERRVDQLEQR